MGIVAVHEFSSSHLFPFEPTRGGRSTPKADEGGNDETDPVLTTSRASSASSLDQLICANQECCRKSHIQCASSFHVDYRLELDRLLDRNFGWV